MTTIAILSICERMGTGQLMKNEGSSKTGSRKGKKGFFPKTRAVIAQADEPVLESCFYCLRLGITPLLPSSPNSEGDVHQVRVA